MPEFKVDTFVEAPLEKVFEYASDLRRTAERVQGIAKIEVLTEGPIRAGTVFRETRVLFKREATEEMEITAYDPPHSYAVDCENNGCHYHTEFRFTPRGSGTDIEMRFVVKALTTVAKIIGVIFWPLSRMCVKECARDLQDLKRSIEADSSIGAPVSAPRSQSA